MRTRLILKDSNGNGFLSIDIERLLIAVEALKSLNVTHLISVAEAAHLLGVSRQSVWKRLKNGSITKYVVAGSVVIDVKELENDRIWLRNAKASMVEMQELLSQGLSQLLSGE